MIEIIENVQAPLFPIVYPEFQATFFLERANGDPDSVTLQLRVSIEDVVIVDRAFDVMFGEGKLRTHVMLGFEGFPIPQAGKLLFALFEGDRHVATSSILVTQTVKVSELGPQLSIPPSAPH